MKDDIHQICSNYCLIGVWCHEILNDLGEAEKDEVANGLIDFDNENKQKQFLLRPK